MEGGKEGEGKEKKGGVSWLLILSRGEIPALPGKGGKGDGRFEG